MHRLLLLGTDTDVGKTTVAAGLCAAVVRRGGHAVACKPVETGFAGAGDLDAIARVAGPSVMTVGGRHFALAAPPTAAARAAGQAPPTAAEVTRLVRAAESAGGSPPDAVIVEGCGGALTPLNDAEYVVDLARSLPDYGLVLVAALELGVLSHTFAVCEYARARRLPEPAIVLVERREPAAAWYRQSTIDDLSRRSCLVAAVVPHMPMLDAGVLAAAVAPLLE